MQPITSIQECIAAALAFDNSETTETETMTYWPRPEGCYKKDGRLWLSLTLLDKENGADLQNCIICKKRG